MAEAESRPLPQTTQPPFHGKNFNHLTVLWKRPIFGVHSGAFRFRNGGPPPQGRRTVGSIQVWWEHSLARMKRWDTSRTKTATFTAEALDALGRPEEAKSLREQYGVTRSGDPDPSW